MWTANGAIAAPDGRTAYRVDNTTVARIDTRSGTVDARYALPVTGAWRVAVVGANAHRVVVTDGPVDREHPRVTTRLAVVDVDAAGSSIPRLLELAGTVQPEALSTDGNRIFILDHHATYYRVRVVDITTGEITDTSGRDKSPAENMTGTAIHAVLNPAGDVLATLYQEPTGQPPFVHVLHLRYGWTYCADLPPGHYDRIARSPDGNTLYVGTTDGSWATVDLARFGAGGDDPLAVTAHPATSHPPVPLAPAGTVTTDDIIVTGDSTGITWSQHGATLGHASSPIDRLVTLAPA